MKTKILIASLVLVSMIRCNETKKDNAEHIGKIDDEMKEHATNDADTVKEAPGVYFVNLKDGDKVKSPVIVDMGVSGMEVEPAGKIDKGKGHHHIIIDGSYVEKGQMVPKDETHLHFGNGQTLDTLQLSPGKHTLTLQFANGVHQSYGKDWSKTIAITVEK
jgi:hypothetical protein